jgi:hypothetical protein
MKPRERILLAITVLAAVSAACFIFLIEPMMKQMSLSDSVKIRNRKYLGLLSRKDDIQKRAKIFDSGYFKNTPEEQQLALGVFMEKKAGESGISHIKSLVPLEEKPGGENNKELSLLIDMECSLRSLTKMLFEIGNSDVPLRVSKVQLTGETGESGTIRAQIEVTTLWINNSNQ